ncbi:hypothetical protein AK830_g3316 [Neonectria ditissima]|uniref:Uncharacterized protein n=1 Tax=Neonectria ditissima TaxID=78410 RepID=A0A0P7BS62_9HYPO|nr:hypothetical protein AK830_g3316 [Neonectria ditissima]
MPFLFRVVTAVAASSCVLLANASNCPPLGAVLPPPLAPSKSKSVQSAIEGLTVRLDEEITSTLNASGISIGVKSLHEDEQLFKYHFSPPVLSGIGTELIDEHTIYRVGSVSKVFPVLVALQSKSINMADSVLEYIPELRNGSKHDAIYGVNWEEVTIGSLASHLSGIASDTAFDLALSSATPWTDMGLPEVPKRTGPDCSGVPGTRPCTANDLIRDINKSPPVYAPYISPSYSNVGFALLSMVIEAATGEKFQDVVQSSVFDAVGMNSTSFFGPLTSFDKIGFVPDGEEIWNLTLGVFEAAGGMFSNTIDMLAFCEAILGNRLLSPKETHQWMKPDTHTSSFAFSAGAPWEIFRSDTITSDGRIVDVYGKGGDYGSYRAFIRMIPDYDVSISVLTGGPEISLGHSLRMRISSIVVETLLPAIEQAGRDEASSPQGFTGIYTEKSTNSSITLNLDSGPGLVISNFTIRGFDVLNNIGSYSGEATEPGHVEGRLYPTRLSQELKGGSAEVAWRAVFDSATDTQKALEAQVFYKDGACQSWFSLDRLSYNFLSLAEFVFVKSQYGEIKAIKNKAFNVTLTKE